MTASDPAVRIEDAQGEEGLRQVRRLFRAYAAEFAASIAESLSVQGFEAELAGLPGRYAPPSGCLLLAVRGDTAAGCMALRDLGGGTCEMKRLHVAPAFRGLGVGRLVVEEVVRRAGQADYRRMVLDTLPEMAGAPALYRACGFVEAEQHWDSPVERTAYLMMWLGIEDDPIGGGSRMAVETLSEVVQADMAAYFEHLTARIERLVRSLTDEELWANPFGFGNSVGRIVVHLTGSLRHYIGAGVAGTGYVRDRAAEFSDPARPAVEELLGRFRDTTGLVVKTLRSQGEAGLTTPVTDCGEPVRDRFGLFLVCAAHVSNHVGQIVYLVQAHGHPLDEKAW